MKFLIVAIVLLMLGAAALRHAPAPTPPAESVIPSQPAPQPAPSRPTRAREVVVPRAPQRKPAVPKTDFCSKVPAIAYKFPVPTVLDYAKKYGLTPAELRQLQGCLSK